MRIEDLVVHDIVSNFSRELLYSHLASGFQNHLRGYKEIKIRKEMH